MDFSDREKQVLEAIIDYYLGSGEAVGSRTLVKKYGMDLSSATIRNVMADLEDTGYIAKVHSSSGRAPTSKGYKYYTEKLMEIKRISEDEIVMVRTEYKRRMNELEDILEKTSQLLSQMSQYAGFVFEPGLEKEKIKKIELVHVNSYTIMAVIVTEDSSVKTKKIYFDLPITEEETKEICEYLNKNLKSMSPEDIVKMIKNFMTATEQNSIDTVIRNCFEETDGGIYIEGAPNVIRNVSIENPGEMLDLINVLEERDGIKGIFNKFAVESSQSGKKVNIVFGEDLNIKGLEDVSFIFSTYNIGHAKGVIGIIGPKRMEYSRTAGLVEYITNEVDKIIDKIKDK